MRRVEQRATGQFLKVQGPAGIVISIAGWMLDPVIVPQSLKLPTAVLGRQMNLLFDDSRLEGLGALERNKVISTLSQILMQAAGVRVEELDDDKR